MVPFDYTDLLKPKDYCTGTLFKFLQVKEDGLRVLVTKDEDGIRAETRAGKTDFWDKLKHVKEIARLIANIPLGTSLDCELFAKGVQATDIKTLINNADERLILSPFAMPFYGYVDFRDKGYIFIITLLRELGFQVPHTEYWDESKLYGKESLEVAKLEAHKLKIEGYVVKQAHYEGWFKIKPVRTVDVVVMDTELSESDSFMGGLKNIKVGVWTTIEDRELLVEIASVGTGFEAEYRMTVEPASLLGKVCEVTYDSLAGKGKLKFPRFLRWRDDKLANECTMDQIK